MERYINLRNTQKQLEITNYASEQKFLRILSSLQWCLFETSRIINIEVRDFASLCIKIEKWFCVTTFDVLSTFYSFLFTFHIHSRWPSSTNYTQKLAAPQCLHYQNGETFSKKWHPLQRINIGMTTFSQEMSHHFDSVNTGELPKVYEMQSCYNYAAHKPAQIRTITAKFAPAWFPA